MRKGAKVLQTGGGFSSETLAKQSAVTFSSPTFFSK